MNARPRPFEQPHPLDGSDPHECYNVMMAERVELIKARREAEDGAIKTKTQISSAILVIFSGYSINFTGNVAALEALLLSFCALFLMLTIILGIAEQRYASSAYKEQQVILEQYFQKKIGEFSEPPANRKVHLLQKWCMISFISAMLMMMIVIISNLVIGYVG